MAIRAPGGTARAPTGVQRKGVFRIEMNIGRERKHAKTRRTRLVLEDAHSFIEQREVASELVDRKPAEQRALFRRQQLHTSNDGSEHAAALDVGDEDPGHLEASHEAQIDEVVRAQVHFGYAPRAFDHDHVEAASQIGIGGRDVRSQFVHRGVVFARRQGLPRSAVHNDLAAPVAGGFQQDRVHHRLGFETARLGLRDLRASNLTTRPARVGIVGHVLGLERRDCHTPASQPRADGRHHPALARVGGRAADKECAAVSHDHPS